MSRLDGWIHRLRVLLNPRGHARELEEEMRAHRDIARLHQPDDRAVALEFGNVTFYREEVRRMTWMRYFDVLAQDTRFMWRSLRRNPVFSVSVIFILALGIGVNSAAFSLLDTLYLREPSGVYKPSAVRRFYKEYFNTGSRPPFIARWMSFAEYRMLRESVGDTASTAAFIVDPDIRMGSHPLDPKISGVYATASYFHVLGVKATLGRLFTTSEDMPRGAQPIAVVSHRFWKSALGGDSAVLGKPIRIESRTYTVVGVMQEDFNGIELQDTDIWLPLFSLQTDTPGGAGWWESDDVSVETMYRGGNTPESAIIQQSTLRFRQLARESTNSRRDTLGRALAGPLMVARGPENAKDAELISTRLVMVSALVFLIALSNVVNLMLARAATRRREFAVRLALGVSRGRMLRMLTTESLLLALLAVVPALVTAVWGGSLLRSLLLPDIQWHNGAMSVHVAVLTVAVTLVAALVIAVVTLLHLGDSKITFVLKGTSDDGRRHRSLLRTSLLAAQASLSVVLLVGAVLFVRSLEKVQSLDIGFDIPNLVFGRLEFAKDEQPARAIIDAELRDIASRLKSRGVVEHVAIAGIEPMRGHTGMRVDVGGSDTSGMGTSLSSVSPEFFSTVGMRLLQGRAFSGAGGEIVINEAFANKAWPGENPLGKCIWYSSRKYPCQTVVGVVQSATEYFVTDEERVPQIYTAFRDGYDFGFGRLNALIVRTRGNEQAAVAELQTELKQSFPTAAPIVRSMKSYLEPQYRKWRVGAMLFSILGALAFVVAFAGIYSTVAYAVVQRTHEFGIRIALGAVLGDLLRLIIGGTVRVIAVGVLAGVAISLASAKLIESLLFQTSAHDPVVLTEVSVLMLLATTLAAVVPAVRAARVDPVRALKAE